MGRRSLYGFVLVSVVWVALVVYLSIPLIVALLGGFVLGAGSTIVGSMWES